MGATKIDWCDTVWNPVTGCTPVSAGCANCYAKRMATRLAGRCGYPKNDPFAVTLHPDRLAEPLHWRKPRRVFVCSMGDLFHEDVPDDYIDRIVAVTAREKQHTFMMLTKRPERMAEYWRDPEALLPRVQRYYDARAHHAVFGTHERKAGAGFTYLRVGPTIPLPNVWLGTSVEDQATADERIPHLLKCPAAVRFVSAEPLLGPIRIYRYLDPVMTRADMPRVNYVIAGGETGPSARPAHPDWFRSLRDQCQAAGVPFFFKSRGGPSKNNVLDGRTHEEFPA